MAAQAAVLAGGLGKRFRPYTEIIPKPMIPLGSTEKPLLEYIIAWLGREGFKDIVLLVGYRWRYIYNYFGDGSRLGVRLRYSLDDEEYKGTGGAILKAVENGLLARDDFVVWYGDIIASVPVAEVFDYHRAGQASATLVVASRYQVPVGVVYDDGEGVVRRVEEKPWLPLKAFIGVAALNGSAIIDAARVLGKSFDVMKDLIPYMVESGYKVLSFKYDGLWYDVGSLERYEKLDRDYIAFMERELGFDGASGDLK